MNLMIIRIHQNDANHQGLQWPMCKVMHISRQEGRLHTTEGKILEQITEENDIGVLVTGDLKLSNHCAKAASMATSVLLRQIQKNFTYRDRFTFVKLYTHTYSSPHKHGRYGRRVTDPYWKKSRRKP